MRGHPPGCNRSPTHNNNVFTPIAPANNTITIDKIVGKSLNSTAWVTRNPSPCLEANISPIKTPSKLNENPSRNADSKSGNVAGINTRHAVSSGDNRITAALRTNAGRN